MATVAASQLAFRFGVELEFLLGSRSKKHKSWTALAAELSARLAKAGVPNHVNAGNEKSADNYREWSIVREVTVPADVGKGLWGTELVSPILSPSPPGGDPDQLWTVALQAIFAVLARHFVLAPTAHAGTHVHVSCEPAGAGLGGSATALAAVAKAALYFEPALDALMPASRSRDAPYWCQSNRASVALRGAAAATETADDLSACFALLDECCVGGSGVESVVRAMCLFPASSAYGRAHGYKADFVHGVYKWDFSGLLPDTGSGTLEYRQCPGSRTADEAHAWVELGLCFVAGAMDAGHALDPLAQQQSDGNIMEDLWWMLCAGAQATGVGELEGIKAMDFTGAGEKAGKAKNGRK